MINTFWRHILLLIALLGLAVYSSAIPAPLKILSISQPDGSQIDGWLKGDEFFHYAVSADGYVLLPGNKGYYNYAIMDSTGSLRSGSRMAKNVNKRSKEDRNFLKTIKTGYFFSEAQLSEAKSRRIQKSSAKSTALRSANASSSELANAYPTTGSPKSLVILVNFSDVKFGSTNTASAFSNMLNQVGYRENYHIGSSRDYYKYNSSGLFSPDFVVAGPVTLNKTRDYYGANNDKDDDTHPALMVKEACELAAASIDFSNFDYNNDGYVDNIYVFYAGKGEADGGGANTIWPHSWAISGEGLSLQVNGKIIENYACSAELTGSGTRTGIGTFTHEYGHTLGLLDMYDSDYAINGQGFDLGQWSLMAYGSYNNNGTVPPCLTLLERAMLNWANPVELSEPSSINLSDLGSTNQGYVITTNNTGEFYLLENRQQTSNPWDAYLPYHGMLVYHIDMRNDASISFIESGQNQTNTFSYLWSLNMVNAISSHQCADIVEADNSQSSSTGNVRSDPFPGLGEKSSFTDTTIPSMKTWNGLSLNKSITSISEKNGVILFNFMGGEPFNISPVALPAKNILPFQFTACWTQVKKATGYYLDVYTLNSTSGQAVKNFVPGYENLFVKDSFISVKVPNDLTNYYYCVRATNDFLITQSSDTWSLTTPDGTPEALPATNIQNYTFTANWKSKDWADGYYLDVYTKDSTATNENDIKYVEGYENRFLADSTLLINDLDDRTTYYYRVRATTGYTDTRNSNAISLTTPKASAVLAYVKDKTINIKGVDPKSTIKVYDLSGRLIYSSFHNKIPVEKTGIYLVETMFNGKNLTTKVLVQ